MLIRLAERQDAETIAEFNTRLAAETEDKHLDPETIRAGVRSLLADPHHGRYFVACVDGKIVGQMMHTREWSDWRNGEIWWLQSVYVHPDHRRGGIFRALYRHLAEMAEQSSQVVGLRLYVEEHNAKAIETYRSLGLKLAGYAVMEKMLGRLL